MGEGRIEALPFPLWEIWPSAFPFCCWWGEIWPPAFLTPLPRGDCASGIPHSAAAGALAQQLKKLKRAPPLRGPLVFCTPSSLMQAGLQRSASVQKKALKRCLRAFFRCCAVRGGCTRIYCAILYQSCNELFINIIVLLYFVLFCIVLRFFGRIFGRIIYSI